MSTEKQNPQPIAKTETELGKSMPEYAEMRDAIINLEVAANKMKLREKAIEEINQKIATKLPKLKTRLDQLAEKYPENDGLRELVRMYEDIRNDFDQGKDIRVDTSLGKRLIEVRRAVVAAGIKSVDSKNIDNPKTKEIIAKLQQLGIPIERVATRPNADRIVILIAWAHPNPGMSDEVKNAFGIFDSQNKVNDYISRLSQSGISNHVLIEGVPAKISRERKAKFLAEAKTAGFGFVNLTKISIDGVEDKAYLLKAATGLNLANYQIRTTINNVILANNIKNSTQPEEVSIALMGAAHEFEIGSKSEHVLPYSQAIAFEANADVIVVNTAKKFDETIRDPKKIELLKQAAANFQAEIKKQIAK